MKKLISILLAAALAVMCLSGCTATPATPEDTPEIVTTVFPIRDWVSNVLGDNPGYMGLTWLLDSGVDMHSYQPGVNDLLDISTCDLFIYVGGESDAWVRDALKNPENPDMIVLDLLDVLGDAALEEELAEGMQSEPGEAEETEYDEHVWLSLRNAALFTRKIAEAIASLDPAHADVYTANANAYCDKLAALDADYEQAVTAAPTRTLLFGDRFPFRYLTEDYGLTYYAAFAGCSAETEASFETVTFLAGKMDELDLPAVLTIEGATHQIAQTIVNNTHTKNQRILTLDSLQSTTAEAAENGVTYLSVMQANLEVLKQALA